MNRTITIGYIGGIAIKLDSSLLLLAILLTAGAAFGLLPTEAPGYSVVVYIIAGLLIATFFIASILWHEMAHVLLAQQFRLPVVQVVLYLFGGMAQIGRDPERPSHEFLIAIAGPISSAILAAFFGLIGRTGGLAGAAAGYLGSVNLTLAVFNLLPGFPLDGGRVLRAALWQLQGSYTRATRQASRAGQGVAILLGLFGLLSFFSGVLGGINGLWLIMVALFLYQAASQTFRMARAAPMPLATTVQRVMRQNAPPVAPNLPLAIFAWRFYDHAPDQAFPVIDGALLVGMLSAVELAPVPRLEWGTYKVRDLMRPSADLPIIAPDDDLKQALAALDTAKLDHAPVVSDGQVVGMLNRRDITYRT
jgi:Zn-dependent protease